MKKKSNLTQTIEKLRTISLWFEKGDGDIEESLAQFKEAAKLLKDARGRLVEIENEFEEVRKEIEE